MADRSSYTNFFNPDVKLKYQNVIIDEKNILEQLINNKERTYDNIQKIANDREENYTISFLLEYNYFKDHYKIIIIIIIIIDLSKKQADDADLKEIQQINFTRKLKANATIFLIL